MLEFVGTPHHTNTPGNSTHESTHILIMSSRQVNKGPDPELGDKYHAASGKAEVIEVIKLLESAGISCCVVGTTALKYFGAHRATEVNWYTDHFPNLKLTNTTGLVYMCPHREI